MSFFNQKGDDSNLQYDDAAFLYFIASFVSLGAVISFSMILKDLWGLVFKDESKLRKEQIFNSKIDNLKKLKRSQVFGKRFVFKVVALVVFVLLFKVISEIASRNQNKLKGFDPYEILGVTNDASLREIKKAYRKLALQYHPDKNIGNAQAQNKFILISKSYECFTDQTKKANCFKFGNPDGANTFRVGIGLPQFFLNVQYQFYVLPIVLTILLVLIPWAMISWNNKIKILNHDGISYNSFNTFFKCFANRKETIDLYTFLYIMTSFPELYEHESCRPITVQDKQQLQKLMLALPMSKKSVYEELNDNQLDLLWQIFSYTAKVADFRSQSLRQSVQDYIGKVSNMILMFANKSPEGQEMILENNPDWKVYYIGYKIINLYLQFEKDFYNRTLIIPKNEFIWVHNLDLDGPAKTAIIQAIAAKRITPNLAEIIRSPQKIQALVEIVPQQSRKSLENQIKSFPIYDISLKMKVGNEQRATLSHVDYAKFYFKVKRVNQTLGYSLINNYPYPKKDSIYILIIEDGITLCLNKVDFPFKQDEFVQKIDYKTNRLGKHVINVFAMHQTIFSIDAMSQFQFNCVEMPKEELVKPIQFHPDDVNMQKLHKTFFEVLLQLEKDPEENELSGSQGEDEEEIDEEEEGQHNHAHGDGDCDQCSDQSDNQILD